MMNFKERLVDLLENANIVDILYMWADMGNDEIHTMCDLCELDSMYSASAVLNMDLTNFSTYNDYWICDGDSVYSFDNILDFVNVGEIADAILCNKVDCDIPEVCDLMNDYHKVDEIKNRMDALLLSFHDLALSVGEYNGEFENAVNDALSEKYPFTADLDTFVYDVGAWVENFGEAVND